VNLLAAILRLFWYLVRDLAAGDDTRQSADDEQAQDDDLLDAARDEDGMDATGLGPSRRTSG
jgi:hypothetical protein